VKASRSYRKYSEQIESAVKRFFGQALRDLFGLQPLVDLPWEELRTRLY
jgi:hypothetical protein